LYLSKPERIITTPSDQSLRGVDVKTNAVMQAVRQACKRDDFRPRTSALCNYCSFQEFGRAFDGQPELARPTRGARQAEREGAPQLPLVFAWSGRKQARRAGRDVARWRPRLVLHRRRGGGHPHLRAAAPRFGRPGGSRLRCRPRIGPAAIRQRRGMTTMLVRLRPRDRNPREDPWLVSSP